jgi:uncharacterized protein (TIGR03492 family)
VLEAGGRKPLLVISNGHGEDSIAAEIVRRLPAGIPVVAYPTLGAGKAYEGVCPLVGPRRFLPSEGHWRKGSFWKDARAGFGIRAAFSFMRTTRRRWNRILVVGDLLGVLVCRLTGNRVSVFADVYRSGHSSRYSGIEAWVIRTTCDRVFSRDALLAGQLARAGADAAFAGNVVMDTLSYGGYDVASRRTKPLAIAILPGSRTGMAENFAIQAAALRLADASSQADCFAVLAGGSDLGALARAGGLKLIPPSGLEAGDLGTLTDGALTVHLVSGSLGNVLATCDVVLGQGGTANLQALGLGRPVISFLPPEAREGTRRRTAMLVGDSREVVPADAAALAGALARLLADPTERQRRGAIGRERIGPPGAMAAIVAALTD